MQLLTRAILKALLKTLKTSLKICNMMSRFKRKQIRKCRFMFCELVCVSYDANVQAFHLPRVMRTDRFKYCTASKVVQTDLVLNTK